MYEHDGRTALTEHLPAHDSVREFGRIPQWPADGFHLHSRPGCSRFFDAVKAWSKGTTRGCAFINAYAEIGGTDHPGIVVIRAEKAWMRARFTELVAEAGIAEVKRVAGIVHLLYEGALVTADVGGDRRALMAARDATERLLANEATPR